MKCTLIVLAGVSWAMAAEVLNVEVRVHNGRPTVFIDGRPDALPTYSPPGFWNKPLFEKTTKRFLPHKMGAYFLSIPQAKGTDFFATPFWIGDEVSSRPLAEAKLSLEHQVKTITDGDPDAFFILRFGIYEPANWRKLHPDQLVVSEDQRVLQTPSLASDLYWETAARFCAAFIQYCEAQPWAGRIIGYANFHRVEGTHEPLLQHLLFDHSALMTARWRAYLREKYKTVEALREAHNDPLLEFDAVPVPSDRLRGRVADVAALPYWQNAKENQSLRDYLLLTRDLFHQGFRRVAAALADATPRKRFYVYDALKQSMLGWSNLGFFDPKFSWPPAYAELMAGSGHMSVADLFSARGCDGLITPHDYQARGMGGVFEPEGSVDSAVLRGKLFLCEMDTRTFTGKDHYGRADNVGEFAAVTWRNLATALTRGFNAYWMDLHEDWFAKDEMHAVIQRQVEVLRESLNWPHETLPGVAMVLDDAAVLETNGSGNFLNETVMWEEKLGLARCGVPCRIYLLEDLKLLNFPQHRVFYFPNLFKVDDARLDLLKQTVFRDGNVVVWGPGSGISDGDKTGKASASRLTGFDFEYWPVNYQRRALISDFSHAITRGLSPDTVLGGPLAYGPLLFPKDGVMLGRAWTKQGRNYAGLAVKSFGKGARGDCEPGARLGSGDYAAVFTTAVPLPADLWRGIARFAGAHVYCETNDVLLADSSVVALHSLMPGAKSIALPGRFKVSDVVSGGVVGDGLDEIRFVLAAPGTRVFLLQPVKP